jgi:spore coat polysaccharide biosynthesis predicted glycosyltransferase SpsG
MVDGDVKPSMAFLYGELEKEKKDIMIGLGNADRSGTLYKEIMDIIDKKKCQQARFSFAYGWILTESIL